MVDLRGFGKTDGVERPAEGAAADALVELEIPAESAEADSAHVRVQEISVDTGSCC